MNELVFLWADIRRKSVWMYGDTVSVKNCCRALLSDGTFAMILFRLSSASSKYFLLGWLGWIFARLNMFINGIVIGSGARIGKGFVIMHSVGVVINGAAVIGRNCVVQSGVVIGAKDRKSPDIGDFVHFGAGSKVIGNVSVGSHVQIGANAVVVKSVESGCTVVGVPARVVGKASLN